MHKCVAAPHHCHLLYHPTALPLGASSKLTRKAPENREPMKTAVGLTLFKIFGWSAKGGGKPHIPLPHWLRKAEKRMGKIPQ